MRTITKKNLVDLIFEQSVPQEVLVQGENGSIVKQNYSKFYYSPEFKQYKWDGTKFVIDYSKIYKNWDTMTQKERDNAVQQRQKVKSVGNYKDQPNLITGAINSLGELTTALKDIVWQNLTFDNIVFVLSKIAPFIPPPVGGKGTEKMLQLIQGIAFFIKFLYSTTPSDLAANFLSGFLSVLEFLEIKIISFLPTTLKNSIVKIEKWFFANIAKISRYVKKTKMAQWIQISLIFLVKNVGKEIVNQINGFIKTVTQNILTPIFKFISSVNNALANIISSVIQTLNEFSTNLDSVNDFYEATKDEQITEGNKQVIFTFKKKDLQIIT